MIRKPALGLLALALLFVGASMHAQSAPTYTTNIVSVNVGNPSWASFYFESVPGYTGPGWESSTALIIECDFNRAELITGFDQYGKLMQSQFFPVNCQPPKYTTVGGYRVVEEALNNTPFTVNLTMQGHDASGNLISAPLTLTVGPTNWQMRFCGRGCNHLDQGSSQITY
jgi:hypothetical protein